MANKNHNNKTINISHKHFRYRHSDKQWNTKQRKTLEIWRFSFIYWSDLTRLGIHSAFHRETNNQKYRRTIFQTPFMISFQIRTKILVFFVAPKNKSGKRRLYFLFFLLFIPSDCISFGQLCFEPKSKRSIFRKKINNSNTTSGQFTGISLRFNSIWIQLHFQYWKICQSIIFHRKLFLILIWSLVRWEHSRNVWTLGKTVQE